MKVQHEHPLNHIGQLTSFGLFVIIWGSDSFYFRWSTYLSEFIPLAVRVSFLVVALSLAAILFKGVISAFPGGNGNISKVLSSGPFKYLRHPMYTACVLFYFALAVSIFSLVSLGLTMGILIFYNYIASYEETFLIERFGEQYSEYQRKTGKLFPRFHF